LLQFSSSATVTLADIPLTWKREVRPISSWQTDLVVDGFIHGKISSIEETICFDSREDAS